MSGSLGHADARPTPDDPSVWRRRVAQAFSRASGRYTQLAQAQRQMGARLVGQPRPRAGAAEEAPSDIAGRRTAVLLEVMQQADALGYSGRYDRLAPVLSAAFNFPLMARVSVGRHWRKLEKSDRGRLVDVFGRIRLACRREQLPQPIELFVILEVNHQPASAADSVANVYFRPQGGAQFLL